MRVRLKEYTKDIALADCT